MIDLRSLIRQAAFHTEVPVFQWIVGLEAGSKPPRWPKSAKTTPKSGGASISIAAKMLDLA
jgi:hypothetical protein